MKDNTKKEREEIDRLVDTYKRIDEIGRVMALTYLSALADKVDMEKAG